MHHFLETYLRLLAELISFVNPAALPTHTIADFNYPRSSEPANRLRDHLINLPQELSQLITSLGGFNLHIRSLFALNHFLISHNHPLLLHLYIIVLTIIINK